MTIEEFMNKYFAVKKELALDGYYIPHICDKLYPRACKGMKRKEFIAELYRFVDIYKNINLPLCQLAIIRRREFEEHQRRIQEG